MRTLHVGLIALCMVSTAPVIANEQEPLPQEQQKQEQQTQEQSATQSQHQTDDAAELEQFSDEAEGTWTPNAYWHCSAYPSGHHHHAHHGYGYSRSQAYYKAMNSCRRYHHYCHAHCHVDHH